MTYFVFVTKALDINLWRRLFIGRKKGDTYMYASNYYHYVYTHERRSGVSNDDVVDIIQGVYRSSRLFLLPGQCVYIRKRDYGERRVVSYKLLERL